MEGYVQPSVTLHVIIKSHDFYHKKMCFSASIFLRKIGTLKRKMGSYIEKKKHRRIKE